MLAYIINKWYNILKILTLDKYFIIIKYYAIHNITAKMMNDTPITIYNLH